MTLNFEDIRRAVVGGGDVSALIPVYAAALGLPNEQVSAGLERPRLLTAGVPRFRGGTIDPFGDNNEANEDLAGVWGGMELSWVAFGKPGELGAECLARLVEKSEANLMAIDAFPGELEARRSYAYSLACASGLPMQAEIFRRISGESYAEVSLSPGDLQQASILYGLKKSVPLLAIGRPPSRPQLTLVPNQGLVDFSQIERLGLDSSLEYWSGEYRQGLGECGDLAASLEIARAKAANLIKDLSGPNREYLIDQGSYLASRLLDIARWARGTGDGIKILVLIELSHLPDFEYALGLLKEGIVDETYQPLRPEPPFSDLLLVGKAAEAGETVLLPSPRPYNPASEIFAPEFKAYVEERENQAITSAEAHRLVADIAGRSRSHPEVARGVSVRGSLALQEISQSLSAIAGGLSRLNVEKAAMIALRPRLLLKKAGREKEIVEDIVKEAIFDISFSGREDALQAEGSAGISGRDILDKLEQMGSLPRAPQTAAGTEKSPSMVVESEQNRELLRDLTQKKLVKKNEQGQYVLTQKALEYLLDDLKGKFESGEISQEEYRRQRSGLMSKMKNLARPQFQMSGSELANTVMEMIDAQDKQWNSEINFNTMHVYYHIKDSAGGEALSPQKRDYSALKRLIDDLEKRQFLAAAGNSGGYVLTGLALDLLLKTLVDQRQDASASGLSGRGSAASHERRQEVRRFSSGDAFRDISLRHTLREIARQKKGLGQVRPADFRVFLKQTRQPQFDILICLDISGSMGFHQKLMYARLAAAGLIQAGLKEGNRVGLVAFNDRGQVSVPLTEGTGEALLDCVAGLSARGNTNIGDGIRASREMLLRSNSRRQKYIILISDGQPSAISESTFQELKNLKERDLTQESALVETRRAAAAGIRLSVIHIAAEKEAGDHFMQELARAGRGNLRRLSSAADLKALLGGRTTNKTVRFELGAARRTT